MQVTCPVLQEPTSVAALSDGRLVVADNAVGAVFIIDDCGHASVLVGNQTSSTVTNGSSAGSKSVASSGHLHLVNAVYCTPSNHIIVCDHRLQVSSLALLLLLLLLFVIIIIIFYTPGIIIIIIF